MKLVKLAFIGVSMVALTACSTNYPVNATSNAIGSRSVEVECASFQGFNVKGNCSLVEAMSKAPFKKVGAVEQEITNYGVYQVRKVRVIEGR